MPAFLRRLHHYRAQDLLGFGILNERDDLHFALVQIIRRQRGLVGIETQVVRQRIEIRDTLEGLPGTGQREPTGRRELAANDAILQRHAALRCGHNAAFAQQDIKSGLAARNERHRNAYVGRYRAGANAGVHVQFHRPRQRRIGAAQKMRQILLIQFACRRHRPGLVTNDRPIRHQHA